MRYCTNTWYNQEFKTHCRCAKKADHAEEAKPDSHKCVCSCEWPGLYPDGFITVVRGGYIYQI